jgi:hypothetical protein
MDNRYAAGASQKELDLLEKLYASKISESEPTTEGISVEEQLIGMHERLITPSKRNGMEPKDIVTNMRSVLEEAPGGFKGGTDAQILAAAKDAYDYKQGIVSKQKAIKEFKDKPISKPELDSKPPEVSDAIVQEKLRNAKSKAHREAIKKKYGVKEDTPTSDPAVAKAEPEIDPLMREDTLFNPKDKSSIALNNKIDAIINKKRTAATSEQAQGSKAAFHINPWIDTTLAFQGVQERSGFPLYSKYYLKGTELGNKMAREVSLIVNNFTAGLTKGYHTPESDRRIVDWITKREGTLNAEEQRTADKLVELFKGEQAKIKYLRMRRWIDGIMPVPKNHKALVAEGRTVLKEKGVGALEEWVKDKKFGVIGGDRYLPAEILRGFKIEGEGDPFSVFNPHVMPRTAEQSRFDVDRPLAAKVHSYMSRVYGDYYFYDYLKNLQGELKNYDIPFEDFNGIRSWLRAVQGHGINVGAIGQFARKARGQFFKTILFDPTKWVRNILQNVAYTFQRYPLSQNIVKGIGTARFKPTDAEREFFSTHISQLGEIRREYLYLYDKFFKSGVLGKIDDHATKAAEIYTRTDEFNRWWAFKHSLSGLDKDIAAYKAGKMSLDKFMTRQGMLSFTDLEIKNILGLAPEQARFQIARLNVEKTQFRYKKHERGTAALSEAGEIGTSLLQFPKGVITMFYDGTRMLASGKSHAERWAGAQILIGMFAMGMVANEVLKKIAGSSTYYDPDLRREVKYEPYSLINSITGISFGGAQLGQVEILRKSIKLIAELASQGVQGKLTEKKALTLTREILKNVDRLGESFIPFLRKSMDVVEGFVDTKYYRALTTSFDKATNRRSALDRNKAERNLIEKFMHAIFGTERPKEEAQRDSYLNVYK